MSRRRVAWHSMVGELSAVVVSLPVSRPIVRSWLHSGLSLAEGDDRLPHWVHLYIGHQTLVSPALFGRPIRFPFCYDYPEIIVAVPDLEADGSGLQFARKPVTYLAHLFLGSWGATLLGRGIYLLNKSFAKFEEHGDRIHVENRHGRRLLDARITSATRDATSETNNVQLTNDSRLFQQPLVVGTRGKLRLARLDIEELKAIKPVRMSLDLAAGFLSWMPEIQRDIPEVTEQTGGALWFQANWRLSPMSSKSMPVPESECAVAGSNRMPGRSRLEDRQPRMRVS